MRPAFSVIFFTTVSGAGYGFLIMLGLLALTGRLPASGAAAFWSMLVALGLVTVGLMSSVFHLGHPERAWRAFSQWRSSWLSREGCLALLTYIPAGLFAIGWLFFGRPDGLASLMALLAVIGSIATLYCTGMIYGSLMTVRQWHHPLVAPLFVAFALATGALWCAAVLVAPFRVMGGSYFLLCAFFVALAWGLKLLYWRIVDRQSGISSTDSATGLGPLGRVRPLDPPHTEENFLLREMGFSVARKHSRKLRRIAVLTGGVLPIAFLLGAQQVAGDGMAAVMSFLTLPFAMLGVFVERWLFFAEARHTVMLYYSDGEI